MIVTTVSNKNPNATSPVLAIIDGKPAWFPPGTSWLTPNVDVEVMITGVIHPMDAAGISKDLTKVKAFLIRGVDEVLDTEVEYEGFSCEGSMCRTLSNARVVGTGQKITITPGSVGVYEADNVNVGWIRPGGEVVGREPLRWGRGWVQHVQGKDLKRLVGVAHFNQLNIYTRRSMFESVEG
jgi:hypothetical protein